MNKILLLLTILTFTKCGADFKYPTCDIIPEHNEYCEAEKYGFKPYYNIEDAIECSKNTGRPILIMFTGYGCVAVRGMNWEILVEKEIKNLIDNYYILTVLYVDDKTKLSVIDTSQKSVTGKIIETVGQKNSNLQITSFNTNAQPFYVFVNNKMVELSEPLGYTPLIDKDVFISHLEKGIENK